MDSIRPLRPIGGYRPFDWHNLNSEYAKQESKSLSPFAATYQFIRYANQLYAQTAAKGVAGILATAHKLQEATRPLKENGSDSVLDRRKAESSDSKAVKATAADDAPMGLTRIEAVQTARAQMNSGASFVKSSLTSMKAGLNTFEIQQGNKTTTVSFNVYTSDTHEQAMSKMKHAINDSNCGVSAQIATDQSGKISLEIQAKETGTAHSFTIPDKIGNAVAATGSHLVTDSARDAEYRIDGGDLKTSGSNTISLDGAKLQAQLLAPTSGDVTLTVKPDAERIASQVKGVVGLYNELRGQIDAGVGIVSPIVRRSAQSMLSGVRLNDLGLSRRPDGTLVLDEKKLLENIEQHYNKVRDALGSPSTGLAAKWDKAASRLQAAPAESLLDRRNSEYMRFANYRSTMELYSQLPFDGTLLNRML